MLWHILFFTYIIHIQRTQKSAKFRGKFTYAKAKEKIIAIMLVVIHNARSDDSYEEIKSPCLFIVFGVFIICGT